MPLTTTATPGTLAKSEVKTVTFNGTANNGAVGTIAIFNVTGRVLLTVRHTFAVTSPVQGGGGTISLGTANNVAGLLTAIPAGGLAANRWWRNTAADNEVSGAAIVDAVSANIILTVAVAAVSEGQLQFYVEWVPLSTNAVLVAA